MEKELKTVERELNKVRYENGVLCERVQQLTKILVERSPGFLTPTEKLTVLSPEIAELVAESEQLLRTQINQLRTSYRHLVSLLNVKINVLKEEKKSLKKEVCKKNKKLINRAEKLHTGWVEPPVENGGSMIVLCRNGLFEAFISWKDQDILIGGAACVTVMDAINSLDDVLAEDAYKEMIDAGVV